MKPYYEADGVTLYHGDCREILPQIKADGSVTDPPYGTEALGGGYGRRQLAPGNDGDGWKIANDGDLTTWAATVPLLRASMPPDAWCLAFCAARRRQEATAVLLDNGAEVIGEVVWDKQQPGLGYTIRYAHETAIVARWGDAKKNGAPLLSVLRGKRTSQAMAERHPHEKPIDVMGRLVQFAVAPGCIVLDPFAGTGATLVAAKGIGRRAIGIELNGDYCEAVARRLSQRVLDFGVTA